MTHFVTVQLRGLRATVDFGVEEHMWSNFVALDQDIITDNGTWFPCYVEFARRSLRGLETTCDDSMSCSGSEAAHGALKRGIEVPEGMNTSVWNGHYGIAIR